MLHNYTVWLNGGAQEMCKKCARSANHPPFSHANIDMINTRVLFARGSFGDFLGRQT